MSHSFETSFKNSPTTSFSFHLLHLRLFFHVSARLNNPRTLPTGCSEWPPIKNLSSGLWSLSCSVVFVTLRRAWVAFLLVGEKKFSFFYINLEFVYCIALPMICTPILFNDGKLSKR